MHSQGSMALAVLLAVSTASFAQTPQDPSAQCSLDLANKPELADITDKLPIRDPLNISFSMLANDAVPTVRERDEIAAWFAAREECKKLGESFRLSNYPPEINTQLAVSITAYNQIGVDLYKGRISYGEANKRFAAARDDLIAKVSSVVEQYKKEIAAQQAQQAQAAALRSQAESQSLQAANQERQAAAQEDAVRQQRTQMILNYMRANRVQLAPPPNLQIRQPVTSNCTVSGSQASCTTQ